MDSQIERSRRIQIAVAKRRDEPSAGSWWWCLDKNLAIIGSQLDSGGHCVIDGFLGTEDAEKARSEIEMAYKSGLLSTRGRIVGDEVKDPLEPSSKPLSLSSSSEDSALRQDMLGWLECSALPSKGASACLFETPQHQPSQPQVQPSWNNLHTLLQKMETLVFELKSHVNKLSGVSKRSRAMVTCYDEGAKYTLHVDNLKSQNGRRLTCIWYANHDWKEGDGGELRFYNSIESSGVCVDIDSNTNTNTNIFTKPLQAQAQAQAQVQVQAQAQANMQQLQLSHKTDVEPIQDRLVLFYSDDTNPHEVLPAIRSRYALTCWFFDTKERAAYRSRADTG
jgi:hypothetical protein